MKEPKQIRIKSETVLMYVTLAGAGPTLANDVCHFSTWFKISAESDTTWPSRI